MLVSFGRYKGRHISELLKDKNYCSWILSEPGLKTKYPRVWKAVESGEIPNQEEVTQNDSVPNIELSDYFKENLRPFQAEDVQRLLRLKRGFLSWDMGCVSGEFPIQVYYKDRSNKDREAEIKLSHLYKRFHPDIRLGLKNKLNVAFRNSANTKSYFEDSGGFAESRILNNAILDVLYQGEKQTYEVVTYSYKMIRTTSDHEFLTPDGFKPLSALSKHDEIIVMDMLDNLPRIEKILWIKRYMAEPVYDLVMADPARNFVCNGFIVHNCGKTVAAVAAVETGNLYPSLIVCPASVKINFQREAYKWSNKLTCIIDSKNPLDYDTNKYDFYIINYDILHKRLDDLSKIPFKSVVFDEQHMLKSGKSLRFNAAKMIVQNIPYRFGLTGTPILNRPSELIAQLQILDRLDDLGGWNLFVKRFCNGHQINIGRKRVWDISGATNLDQLRETLTQTCMIRRLKSEVYAQLPSRNEIPIYFEIDNRKEYQKVLDDFLEWIKAKKVEEEEFKSYLESLPENQKAVAKERFKANIAQKYSRIQQLAKIEPLRQVALKGKMEQTKEWINNFLESSNEKLIVFCHHIDVQKELVKHFKCLSILGGMKIEDRQSAIDRFQNETGKDTQLIICSIKAASVGITLTAADNVAFLEIPWEPATLEQCISRADIRLNVKECEKESINIYYLFAENTIEQDIFKLIQSKKHIIDSAIDGEVSVINNLMNLMEE